MPLKEITPEILECALATGREDDVPAYRNTWSRFFGQKVGQVQGHDFTV